MIARAKDDRLLQWIAIAGRSNRSKKCSHIVFTRSGMTSRCSSEPPSVFSATASARDLLAGESIRELLVFDVRAINAADALALCPARRDKCRIARSPRARDSRPPRPASKSIRKAARRSNCSCRRTCDGLPRRLSSFPHLRLLHANLSRRGRQADLNRRLVLSRILCHSPQAER